VLVIPVQPLPNQVLQVQLENQPCTIQITQLAYGLFISITCATMINGGLFGVICQNLNRVVRDLYLGFVGDFVFVDSQGQDDPVYTGLGTRFQLIYLEESDLSPNQG
jgi:hypothetical protein